MILSKPSGERIFYTSPKKNCRDYFINAPSNFKDASYLEGILDLTLLFFFLRFGFVYLNFIPVISIITSFMAKFKTSV